MKKNYIIIPYSMLSMNITPRAILLYGIIFKLTTNMKKETFATNTYFAKQLDTTNRTINNLLVELENNKCIKIRQDETNKNLRYITPLIINELPVYFTTENKEENNLKENNFKATEEQQEALRSFYNKI